MIGRKNLRIIQWRNLLFLVRNDLRWHLSREASKKTVIKTLFVSIGLRTSEITLLLLILGLGKASRFASMCVFVLFSFVRFVRVYVCKLWARVGKFVDFIARTRFPVVKYGFIREHPTYFGDCPVVGITALTCKTLNGHKSFYQTPIRRMVPNIIGLFFTILNSDRLAVDRTKMFSHQINVHRRKCNGDLCVFFLPNERRFRVYTRDDFSAAHLYA